ncbi:GTPase Der-like isoform X1 [Phoenix dactylifera]|uniref:GTPase Der-like isoform X1 n=1 Tax=Phoenix dactylifera TaxID=42345 RepID=A0A8B8ZMC5_PHODC|nr:GTPase Der-like isoform X1 [Phoenix dactylifera]
MANENEAAIRPPTFVFFVNDAKLFPETYRRYMKKQLRSDAGFPGTPMRLLWRSRRRADNEGKTAGVNVQAPGSGGKLALPT